MPAKSDAKKEKKETKFESKPKAPKKVAKVKTEEVPEVKKETPAEPISVEQTSEPKPIAKNIPNVLYLGLGLLAALAVLGYFLYRTEFVVAMVNGQPITQLDLIKELEKESGKKTLDSMITKQLIIQEAAKENVAITDADIQPEIQKIETSVTGQGQSLDTLLEAQGMTRTDLQEQIKIQKMVEKMAAKDVSVSDQDIDTFIKDNQQAIPANIDKNTVREQAKEQLTQQKTNEAIQDWLTNLRAKAQVTYNKTF